MIAMDGDTILVILIASAVALIVRAYDTPTTDLKDKKKLILGYLSSLVAVVVAAYLADGLGIVLATWAGLVFLASAGIAGMSFIRAVLQNKITV